LGMRPSNPLRNVALCKNRESVAIAPQLLEEIPQREAAIRYWAYLFWRNRRLARRAS
jgi:ABC-type antimicrobial peptide transport system ATPase subunit